MTTELFSVAGVTTVVVLLFTLLFQYVPGLRLAWGKLKSEEKKGIVLAIYLVVGAFVAFGGCFPAMKEVIPSFVCSEASPFANFVFGVLVAIGAGQGAFSLLPELGDVSGAKASRK